jgi:hypothetical protein
MLSKVVDMLCVETTVPKAGGGYEYEAKIKSLGPRHECFFS